MPVRHSNTVRKSNTPAFQIPQKNNRPIERKETEDRKTTGGERRKEKRGNGKQGRKLKDGKWRMGNEGWEIKDGKSRKETERRKTKKSSCLDF